MFRYIYHRHLMSRLFNWLARTSLGITVMDTQCGLKGFEAGAAREIFSRVLISGFAFDVEVLLIAQRLGYRIAELPVTCAYRGEISTVRILRHAASADLILYLDGGRIAESGTPEELLRRNGHYAALLRLHTLSARAPAAEPAAAESLS